jgi:hypothetical protein
MHIYGKKWYYGLKKSDDGYKSNLLDEYKLSDVTKHLIVCLEPDKLPGQHESSRTKEGKLHRYFALFDSYLDFYTYMLKFPIEDRNFFEVILGDLPQKPHFDIDISKEKVGGDEDIVQIGDILYQAVIQCSIEVLEELSIKVNIETDILIYNSHGIDKRSYHILINNRCHDGNEEAKAFYDAVIEKIKEMFTTKNPKYLEYIKLNLIDRGVYSVKQQFRIMGCQKYGSNRPKRFLEKFKYHDIEYTHKYIEEFRNVEMKKLAVLYESLVSFVSGCSYLPSLVKPKIYNNYGVTEGHYLSDDTINRCMNMLREKMEYCPFSISSVDDEKNTIYLKREAPSYCQICKNREPHESRDPLIYIFKGAVYWNCLRHDKGVPNLYLGDLSMNILELQNLNNLKNLKNKNEEIDDDSSYDYNDEDPKIRYYTIPTPDDIKIDKSDIKIDKSDDKLDKSDDKLDKSDDIKIDKSDDKLDKSDDIKIDKSDNKLDKSDDIKIDKSDDIKLPVVTSLTKDVHKILCKSLKEALNKKATKQDKKLEGCENLIINLMSSKRNI